MSKNIDPEEQRIKELTLLLLYLTAWQEKDGFGEGYRSWKGYPFDALNELSEDGLIYGNTRAKSVYFTDQGVEAAKALLSKYMPDSL